MGIEEALFEYGKDMGVFHGKYNGFIRVDAKAHKVWFELGDAVVDYNKPEFMHPTEQFLDAQIRLHNRYLEILNDGKNWIVDLNFRLSEASADLERTRGFDFFGIGKYVDWIGLRFTALLNLLHTKETERKSLSENIDGLQTAIKSYRICGAYFDGGKTLMESSLADNSALPAQIREKYGKLINIAQRISTIYSHTIPRLQNILNEHVNMYTENYGPLPSEK